MVIWLHNEVSTINIVKGQNIFIHQSENILYSLATEEQKKFRRLDEIWDNS